MNMSHSFLTFFQFGRHLLTKVIVLGQESYCLSTCALGRVEVISCAIKHIWDQNSNLCCLFIFVSLVCWKARYFDLSKDSLAQNCCLHKKKLGQSVWISHWILIYVYLRYFWWVTSTQCSTLKDPLRSKIVKHENFVSYQETMPDCTEWYDWIHTANFWLIRT